MRIATGDYQELVAERGKKEAMWSMPCAECALSGWWCRWWGRDIIKLESWLVFGVRPYTKFQLVAVATKKIF